MIKVAVAEASTNSDVILANMPIPLLLLDGKGQAVFVNDACEVFLGQSRRKLLGGSVSDILSFEDSRLNEALWTNQDDLTAQDMLLKLPNGAANVDISISAVASDAAEGRLIILTPRNAEHNHINDGRDSGVQQAMGAPAILSHEIKNPLAGIKGGAQLLAKMGDEKQKPLTDLIINEVDRIARLLDQMQALGGAQPLQSKPENIHLLIEKAITSIRAANADMPEITINYDPSLPDVMIDADAMLQILINLIQNAADALQDVDQAEIGISTRYVMSGALREAKDNDDGAKALKLPVEVAISDNGPGIPKHILGEVFSPFVTTKREGRGLGLAIVRKLIQQMRSRILHERDDVGGLTSFKLYLPVANSEPKS